jgi:uncharacterized protein (TIGR03083 family)
VAAYDSADCAAAYRELRGRVTELVRAQTLETLDEIAPATPEWRVRDVLAHLVGVCDDLANQRLDGVATDPWTAAQVDHRRDWSLEKVLADWAEHAPTVEAALPELPYAITGQLLADAATHEQDIRGAINVPGGRDSAALAIGFDWGTDVIGTQLAAHESGTLTFATAFGTKTVGTGDPQTTVRADRFEFVRAMAGRRSPAQMRAYTWEGEPRPDRLVLAPIFRPPEVDLVE